MHIATVSSKNQITIPVKLLRSLGIKPGSKVIVEEKDEILTAKPVTESIIGMVAGSLNKYVSSDKLGKTWPETKKEMDETMVKEYKKKNVPASRK